MTFWTGLSISGGVLGFLLLARGSERVTEWICVSGQVQALAGIVCAVLFFTLGPVLVAGSDPAPGISLAVSPLPKLFGLSWEPNIYASLLAAIVIFGFDKLLSRGRIADKILVPVMAVAIALGVTRGAYFGLAAGLVVYALFAAAPRRLWARRTVARVGIRGAVVTGSLLVGLVVASVLMRGGRPPTKPLDFSQPGWGRAAIPVAPAQPGSTGGTAVTPAAPVVVVIPPPDTIAFRLARVPDALDDLSHSLLIGLGANSFGQRHTDVSQNAPDHLAILALAAVYESGVLGAAGLAVGFGLVLWMLFKSTRRRTNRGTIAAYAGAVVCLLVAYQATNALNFSLIWLLTGAGLAAATEPVDPSEGLSEPLPG